MRTLQLILKPLGVGILFLLIVSILAPSYPVIAELFDTFSLFAIICIYIISQLYFKKREIEFIVIVSIVVAVLNFLISVFIFNSSALEFLMYSLPLLYMVVTLIFIKVGNLKKDK